MTVDRSGCPADRHGTGWAVQRRGCTCPEGLAARRASRGRQIASRRRKPGPIADGLSADRFADTVRLTRLGYSAADIAIRLGVASRTVTRYRAAHRAQAQLVSS